MPQVPGRRWLTEQRQGLSHREAGSRGGQARCWAPPRSPQTREEAALRYWMGEATQAELCQVYAVSRTTMRRWCSSFNEQEGSDDA